MSVLSIFLLNLYHLCNHSSIYDVCIEGLYDLALRSTPAPEYPVPPRFIGMMSSFFNNFPVNGQIQSFFMIFSTQSIVTTSPVGFRTAHGTEFPSKSWVTGQMYLTSLAMSVLPSSFKRVNLTGCRSFSFRGFPLNGQ